MKGNTKKGQSIKKVATCVNVEEEFTQRFLSLFSSLYYTPSFEEIATFPPVEKTAIDDQNNTKTPPFHSGVWDFRLKKAVETRIENDKNNSNEFDKYLHQMQSTLSENVLDLEKTFATEKAPRPEKPKYMVLSEKDQTDFSQLLKEKHKRNVLDITKTERIFTRRLKKIDEKALERAKRRFMCVKKGEEEHMNFVNSFKKTESTRSTPKKDTGTPRKTTGK